MHPFNQVRFLLRFLTERMSLILFYTIFSGLSDQTGVSIKMIQCIENGSVNPSYEILFPIVRRLGLTTSDLFNVEPDEHSEEINRFLGKFRACNRANQMVLLNTLDFLAEQLLELQTDEQKD